VIPGFAERRVAVGDVSLAVHTAGAGPAVLLLHGYPQTHFIWRFLAPALADAFAVVVPDVKGYGASDAPAPAADASNYAKRALAAECVALMASLGHQRFHVVGHDRGARIAYRMALDHPERVSKLVTLDIVPTGAAWEGTNPAFSLGSFHWGFLAQPGGLAERMIANDPDFFLRHLVARWAGTPERMTEEALAHYCQAYRRPEVIAASCADYRAGATIDYELDVADVAAGRRIGCPVFAILSSTFGGRKKTVEPLDLWRRYATDVRVMTAPGGHFIPEEAPKAVLEPIRTFLAA
jgi:haloacetate dehalogenase